MIIRLSAHFLILAIILSGTASYSQTGIWTTASSKGFTPRSALTSSVVNGKIYVMGGYNASNYFNVLEVYDPAADTWSTPKTSGTFTARRGLTSAVVNGKIYVMGGFDGSKVLSTLEVFDPQTNSWSTPQTTGTFTAREKLCSSVIDNKIYAMGGFDGTTHLNTLEVFDPVTNTWSTPVTQGTFTPRRGLTSSVDGGKIYVMGGYNGTKYLNTLEVYDPLAKTWSTPASSGAFTERGALCSGIAGGKIYAMGGIHFISGNYVDVNTVEVFDTAANTWSTPQSTGTFTPRYEMTCSIVNGKFYVLGGTNTGVVLNTNEVFSPDPNNEVAADASPNKISFFPNPTTGIIAVHNAPENLMSVTVVNALGENVIELASPHASDFTLDLSKFAAGTYYAKFLAGSSVVVKKIVRE